VGGFVQCLPVAAAFVGRRALMGGMSTDCGLSSASVGTCEYAPLGGWKAVFRPVPGGSMAHCWALRQQARGHGERFCGVGCGRGAGFVLVVPAHGLGPRKSRTGWCGWWGVGVLGLLFGNCIVDASILYRDALWGVPGQKAISLI